MECFKETWPVDGEQRVQASLDLGCSDISNSQNAQCSEERFYSSLNLACSDVGKSGKLQFSEDSFDSPLNMECSEIPSDQSSEDEYMSLDLECTAIDCDDSSKDFDSQSPKECKLMSPNQWESQSSKGFEPFESQSRISLNHQVTQREIQEFDTNAEQEDQLLSVKQQETAVSPEQQENCFESRIMVTGMDNLQGNVRPLSHSSSEEHTVIEKTISFLEKHPGCDVVVKKSGDKMIICDRTYKTPMQFTSGLSTNMPKHVINTLLNSRNTILPAGSSSENSNIKLPVQNNERSLGKPLICDNSPHPTIFCNRSSSGVQINKNSVENNSGVFLLPSDSVFKLSQADVAGIPLSESDGCQTGFGSEALSEINVVANADFPSVTPPCITAQENCTARQDQYLYNGPSTSQCSQSEGNGLAEPAGSTHSVIHDPTHYWIHDANNSWSQQAGTDKSSWIECDQNDWLYYVRPGNRRFLNVKKKDLPQNCRSVVHSLVRKILALELCLKRCSGRDKSRLSSFIEQEKTDAQDLEELLNTCKVNDYNNIRLSDSILSGEKIKEVKYQLNESNQTVTREHCFESDNSIPSASGDTVSFLNVDHHGEEDNSLSIRIESVFSLSTPSASHIDSKDQSQTSAKQNSLHRSPVIKDSGKKTKSLATGTRKKSSSKALQKRKDQCKVLGVPPYVVLERLTVKQMNKQCRVSKCSAYCRKMTLQLMCDLGLTDCSRRFVNSFHKLWETKVFDINGDHNYACRNEQTEPKRSHTRKNDANVKMKKHKAGINKKQDTKSRTGSNNVIKILPKLRDTRAEKVLKFTKVSKPVVPSWDQHTHLEQVDEAVQIADHNYFVKCSSKTRDDTVPNSIDNNTHSDQELKGAACQTNMVSDTTSHIEKNVTCLPECKIAQNLFNTCGENKRVIQPVTFDKEHTMKDASNEAYNVNVSSTVTSDRLSVGEQPREESRQGSVNEESVAMGNHALPVNEQYVAVNKYVAKVNEKSMADVKSRVNKQNMTVGQSGVSWNEQHTTIGQSGVPMNKQHATVGKSGVSMNEQYVKVGNFGEPLNEQYVTVGKTGVAMNEQHMTVYKSGVPTIEQHVTVGKSGVPINEQHVTVRKTRVSMNEQCVIVRKSQVSVHEQNVAVGNSSIPVFEKYVEDNSCGGNLMSNDACSLYIPGKDGLGIRVERRPVDVTTVTVYPKTPITQTLATTSKSFVNNPVVVTTECSPKSSPWTSTSTSLNKPKYVSLLNRNHAKAEVFVSSRVYHNPADPVLSSDTEIVTNTHDSSISQRDSVSRIDPNERYALCMLYNKSYLVQLTKDETISPTECDRIVSRLMKHVASKGRKTTNMRSLLTGNYSFSPNKVQSLARSSDSVPSCPVGPCETVASPCVTSVTSSSCISLSTSGSLLNPFQHMKQDECVPKVLPLSGVTDECVGDKYSSQHSEKHIFSEKRIKQTANCHQQMKLAAQSNPLSSKVTIKKEPVEKCYEYLEGSDFRESKDSEAAQNTSVLSVQQPKKEREDDQWQQIWCSSVMPANDPESEIMSAPQVVQLPKGSHTARSGGSIFEKMYSEFNVLHAPSASNDTITLPVMASDGQSVLVSRRETTKQHRSLFDSINSTPAMTDSNSQDDETERILSPPLLFRYDEITPAIALTDMQENILSKQQLKIQHLKELLRQKDKELNQLRGKSRDNSE